jgi:elongation factor P--(R)-beta-lysine ligase
MKDLEQIALERQTINEAIRAFFKEREFVEVETPVLVASPDIEPSINPFESNLIEHDGQTHPAALITSPEYSMKKLLGSGMKKIFTITKVFRNNEELGNLHNPEFSLLEWYAQGDDYNACMDETEELVHLIGNAFQKAFPKFKRVRVRDLFLEFVKLDLDDSDASSLKDACDKNSIHYTPDDSESDLFYRLFLKLVEPNIGTDPIFVYDYPKYQAALSQLTDDKKYGQRFELYINGIELCNGFTELTDSIEQRTRFKKEASKREDMNKTTFPIDEELLKLLPSIQDPTYGNALGIDRLHMVLTGKSSIEDALLFPAKRLFK